MRILIVDDEPNIREGLVQLLQLFCKEVSEITEASSVEEGILKFNEFKPDLMFTDIELSDGTGFDLVAKLGPIETPVIFITAHNKYAVEAFKFCAIDFLTKPIAPEELMTAVEKAKNQIKNNDLSAQLKLFKQLLEHSNDEKKIVLKDSKSVYFVKINDILHCVASGSYTDFHLLDGTKITVSKPLKEYEQMLASFNFIRSHHSHLVNISHINKLDKQDGGSIVLNNGIELPISQRKWEKVLKMLSI